MGAICGSDNKERNNSSKPSHLPPATIHDNCETNNHDHKASKSNSPSLSARNDPPGLSNGSSTAQMSSSVMTTVTAQNSGNNKSGSNNNTERSPSSGSGLSGEDRRIDVEERNRIQLDDVADPPRPVEPLYRGIFDTQTNHDLHNNQQEQQRLPSSIPSLPGTVDMLGDCGGGSTAVSAAVPPVAVAASHERAPASSLIPHPEPGLEAPPSCGSTAAPPLDSPRVMGFGSSGVSAMELSGGFLGQSGGGLVPIT